MGGSWKFTIASQSLRLGASRGRSCWFSFDFNGDGDEDGDGDGDCEGNGKDRWSLRSFFWLNATDETSGLPGFCCFGPLDPVLT
jgi:hypothetical protein